MNFGHELKKARLRKGLTQLDVAKHLCFDHTYVSKMENGKAPMPDLDILLKWAFFVGCKNVVVNYVVEYPGWAATAALPEKAV